MESVHLAGTHLHVTSAPNTITTPGGTVISLAETQPGPSNSESSDVYADVNGELKDNIKHPTQKSSNIPVVKARQIFAMTATAYQKIADVLGTCAEIQSHSGSEEIWTDETSEQFSAAIEGFTAQLDGVADSISNRQKQLIVRDFSRKIYSHNAQQPTPTPSSAIASSSGSASNLTRGYMPAIQTQSLTSGIPSIRKRPPGVSMVPQTFGVKRPMTALQGPIRTVHPTGARMYRPAAPGFRQMSSTTGGYNVIDSSGVRRTLAYPTTRPGGPAAQIIVTNAEAGASPATSGTSLASDTTKLPAPFRWC